MTVNLPGDCILFVRSCSSVSWVKTYWASHTEGCQWEVHGGSDGQKQKMSPLGCITASVLRSLSKMSAMCTRRKRDMDKTSDFMFCFFFYLYWVVLLGFFFLFCFLVLFFFLGGEGGGGGGRYDIETTNFSPEYIGIHMKHSLSTTWNPSNRVSSFLSAQAINLVKVCTERQQTRKIRLNMKIYIKNS